MNGEHQLFFHRSRKERVISKTYAQNIIVYLHAFDGKKKYIQNKISTFKGFNIKIDIRNNIEKYCKNGVFINTFQYEQKMNTIYYFMFDLKCDMSSQNYDFKIQFNARKIKKRIWRYLNKG